MPGDASDRVTIESRRALLDALGALAPHADRLVLVGGHAVYLHTDDIITGIAPYTKDADLALIPPLDAEPDIDSALRGAQFTPGRDPGIWESRNGQVDLLVPEMLSPPGGRRAARLPGHGHPSARKVSGIEGAAVDNAYRTISALDALDARTARIKVAGPGALLISKAIKVAERQEEAGQRRLLDKDAFDAYRLLQLPATALFSGIEQVLGDDRIRPVALTGLDHFRRLFASEDALGVRMAGRYVEQVGEPETVRRAIVALAVELLEGLDAVQESKL